MIGQGTYIELIPFKFAGADHYTLSSYDAVKSDGSDRESNHAQSWDICQADPYGDLRDNIY